MTSAAARISTQKSASRLELGASAGPAVQMGATCVCSSFLHRDLPGCIRSDVLKGSPSAVIRNGNALCSLPEVDHPPHRRHPDIGLGKPHPARRQYSHRCSTYERSLELLGYRPPAFQHGIAEFERVYKLVVRRVPQSK